jgi:hypothetical protein
MPLKFNRKSGTVPKRNVGVTEKVKEYILTKNENWDGQREVIGSLLQKVNNNNNNNNKGKVIPLQARCGPEGGYRYSSTVP